MRSAILLGDHQILRHVDQPPCQVARVGGLQRGVGQALARAVGRDEVLQNIKTLAEIGRDRRLDDRAVRLGHQATHSSELADLRGRPACARVGHHVDRIERFLVHFVAVAVNRPLLGKLGHHDLGDFVTGLAPDVDHFVVALPRSYQARCVLLPDLFDLLFGALDDGVLFLGDKHVVDANRNSGLGRQAKAVLQQLVGEHHRLLKPALSERHVDELGDFLLLQGLVNVGKGQTFGQYLRQQGPARGRLPQLGRRLQLAAVLVLGVLGQAHIDARGQIHFAGVKGALHFTDIGEDQTLSLAVDALTRRVVKTQHHVLRRNDGRLSVGREKHIVGRQHQRAALHLRLHRQGNVNGHLVAVEVGVEGRADQRV